MLGVWLDNGGTLLLDSATLALISRWVFSVLVSLTVFLGFDRRTLKQSVQEECHTCNRRLPQEQLGGLVTHDPQNLGAEVLRLKYAAVSCGEKRDIAFFIA